MPSSIARLPAWLRWAAYAGSVALFLWVVAQFYLPGEGFTALLMLSEKQSAHYVPELRACHFYQQGDYGYDGQYYVQIAMHPQLCDPVLREAVDNVSYRARRILFGWTAYIFGLGHPPWVLTAYALQNVVAWLLLSWVLLRWFPPSGWGNFLRWFATLFTCGLCFSVRASLVDGPSLLLLAVAMLLLERSRPWWSTLVLGAAGLGKETNILAAAVLAPTTWRERRGWPVALVRAGLVVLPLAIWFACLQAWFRGGENIGGRNFALPFAGYFRKWEEAWGLLAGSGTGVIGRTEVCVMIALTVQWLYFVLRPRLADPWWRLGAGYATLMVVLGDAVWEGFPGAAARVLLPMVLAFNVTLPRGWRWWPLLLLGNLLVLPSFLTLVPPGREDSRVVGPVQLKENEATHEAVTVRFPPDQWHEIERTYLSYWRWSRGSASLTVHNPHPYPIRADVHFRLKSSDARNVTVTAAGKVWWSGPTGESMADVDVRGVTLPPGDMEWRFDTDRPAALPPVGGIRTLAFRVVDFRLTLLERTR